MIPVMLAKTAFAGWWPREERARILGIAVLSLAAYAAVVIGLRYLLPPQGVIRPYRIRFGLPLLHFNIAHWSTWKRLAVMLNVLPILCARNYRGWPRVLRGWFWVLVPAWFVVHFTAAVAAETRLFLVPVAVVLVPGSLLALDRLPSRTASA